MDPGAQYQDKRGKYDRSLSKKHVDWKTAMASHAAKIQNASLLSEARCSMKCKHQQQCMMSAFT
eukprot:1554769-Pleurochrysis_carterae.AAC.1